MKAISIIGMAMLLALMVQAKTYTIGSGKWSDPRVWGSQYPGSTIKAGDVVIITGQVTLTTPIVVEGILRIEKGGSMAGMKDLTIAKSGRLINNGSTVVRRIVNEGSICITV